MTSKEKLTSLVSALEITGEANIKKDVVKQYKEDIEKDLEILEILKPALKKVVQIKETAGGLEMSFKPTTFYIAKVMDLDFNFNDTENIKNIRKVKEWLNERQEN